MTNLFRNVELCIQDVTEPGSVLFTKAISNGLSNFIVQIAQCQAYSQPNLAFTHTSRFSTHIRDRRGQVDRFRYIKGQES
jgi:hypothetical protein